MSGPRAREALLGAAVLVPAALCLVWSLAAAQALRDGLPVFVRRGTALSSPDMARPATGSEEEPPALEPGPDGVIRPSLADLAFDDYDPPELRVGAGEALGPSAFPPAVAALDGRAVEVRGYPVVVDLEGDSVRGFLLSRFPPGCCFGAVPVPDEWLDVRGAADTDWGDLVPVSPVTVRGTLEVGERIDADGFVLSLYRLVDAAPVHGP